MSEAKEVPINSFTENETFTPSLFISTLKIFKALPVKAQKPKSTLTKKVEQRITESTIKHGFIFSQNVLATYSEQELRSLIDTVSEEFGITPSQMNSTFNKSWGKVRDAPWMQLLAEQVFHYMTTYGYKSMGAYDERTVFIPNERLDIPEIKGDIKLTVINGYTKSQLKEKLLKFLNSGIAANNINEIVVIANHVKLSDTEVINLKNKEVRTKLYSQLDLIPQDPTELLRLAVYETTGDTLLINNRKLTKAIKEKDNGRDMAKLFTQYDEEFSYRTLSHIYNRFKPIFIAFKKDSYEMSRIINKLGHLSKKYHKPMKPSLLNNITSMLNHGEPIYPSKLNEALSSANIWRKIRLAQSLKYRMEGHEEILYKVRNGKSYASKIKFKATADAEKVYDIIIESICSDLTHLKNKEIYIHHF